MNRSILIFSLMAVGLFVMLYGLFDTKSPELKREEEKRQFQFSSTNMATIEQDAKAHLGQAEMNVIESLEYSARQSTSDTAKLSALKELSSAWFQFKEPAMAGFYAEEVAKIDSSDEAWSIAGTTFAYGPRFYEEEKKVTFCAEHAIAAFENAISLNPSEVSHRTNLAVMYADFPPKDNPMKGILMLRELQETYPTDTGVLIQLARFGIQTGQFEKAAQRLLQVLDIDPENNRANCMLVDVYTNLNNTAEAEVYRQRCK